MEAKNLIKVGDIMFQRPPAHEASREKRLAIVSFVGVPPTKMSMSEL